MAIKIGLSLEGTDKVESQIDSVAKKGEELSKSFNEIGKTGGGLGVDKIVNDLKNAGLNFDQVSEKSIKLSGSFNVLRASLRLLGVEGAGALGSLSKLFSGGGALALGGVAAGVAAVKIGQMEEGLAKLGGELTDTFGSAAKGQAAFAALQKSAQNFGTSVGDLAPGLIAFQTALANVERDTKGFVALQAEDLPAAFRPPDVNAVTVAYDNFIKVLRAGRLTQDEAGKSAKAFFDAFKDGGLITSAALKQLPIGSIELLKEAVGAAGLTTKQFFTAIDAGSLTLDKLAAALQNFGPQAQRAFDTKAVKTMGDEFDKLLGTLNKGFASLSGKSFSDTIIASLSAVNSAIQKIIDGIDAIIEKDAQLKGQALLRATGGLTTGPTLEQAFPPGVAPFPTPEQAGKVGVDAGRAFGKGFIDASKSLEQLGATGLQTGEQIAQGANKVAEAYKQAVDQIQKLNDALEASGEQGRGGEPFKGRLNQIAVSVPQLAGAAGGAFKDAVDEELGAPAGAKTGQQFGQKWVQAVEKEIKIDPSALDIKSINETLPEEKRQILLKPVLSDEELQANALAAGQRFYTKLQEGIDTQPPPKFPNVIDGLDALGQTVADKVQQLWEQVRQIIEQPINFKIGAEKGFGGQLEGAPFAAGGMVRGPGSTTSDSIMAFLSNREWVVNARAVDFYGSNLFAALNSMRLPRNLLSMPKFAEGGQVQTGGTPVHLHFGGKSFALNTVGGPVVDELRRFSVHTQLASIGRKPGFVR